jgi:hypothetical protein
VPVHPAPVPTVGDAVSLIARKQAVVRTVSLQRFDNHRIVLRPVGFQNSVIGPDLGFYAARSYSLMRPPRTGRRLIRLQERSATR